MDVDSGIDTMEVDDDSASQAKEASKRKRVSVCE